MVQKAVVRKPIGRRIKDLQDTNQQQYGLIRRRFSAPQTIGIPSGAGAIGTSPVSGNFLRTEGDSMIGPIAYFPRIAQLTTNGELTISAGTNQYSTYVIVLGEGGADDDLVTITGAAFSGQVLYMQANSTTAITIKDGTGNIRTGGIGDVTVLANGIAILIFDPTVGSGGQWALVAYGAGSGGGGGDNLGNHIMTQALNNNTFSHINYVGWTGLVQQSQVVDGTGTTWTLPSGDSYKFQVDADTELEITSIGLAVRESIQFDDRAADPTAPSELQRNGADLKVFSGGAVRNLSDIAAGAAEVPTWTQNHDTDGFNLIIDQDGDSGLIMDRDALVGDDQLGIALNGLGTIDYLFTDSVFNIKGNTITEFTGWTNGVGQTFVSDGSGSAWTLPATDTYVFNINGVPQLTVTETIINNHSNSHSNFVGWTNGVGQSFVSDGNGATWSLPASDAYLFNVTGAAQFTVSETILDNHSNSHSNYVGWTAAAGQTMDVGGNV